MQVLYLKVIMLQQIRKKVIRAAVIKKINMPPMVQLLEEKITVSLVFTGIAATTLSTIDPSLASIVQGTIVAAAIINEIIAVIIAKFAFVWAGEIEQN